MAKKTKFIIGIDVGGTNTKIGLIKGHAIKSKLVLKTKQYFRKKDLLGAIIKETQNLLKKNGLSKNDILGIGIGLPGAIDYKRGIVHYLPNIPGWKDVYLARLMQQRCGIPTYIDNDVNLMALAELHYGYGKGKSNIVCITLGTGVGGGLVLEGRLYRGTNFAAGELGHIPVAIKGQYCSCGGYGCLESFIGNSRILKRAKQIFGSDITLEKLSRLANRGNIKAIKIWQDVGNFLGVALAGVVNLLNPQIIIIGGGVAGSGRILFSQIKKTINERAMLIPKKEVEIRKAKVEEPGIIGAGILVRDSLKLKYS